MTSSGVHWGSSTISRPLNGAVVVTRGASGAAATWATSRARSSSVTAAGNDALGCVTSTGPAGVRSVVVSSVLMAMDQ